MGKDGGYLIAAGRQPGEVAALARQGLELLQALLGIGQVGVGQVQELLVEAHGVAAQVVQAALKVLLHLSDDAQAVQELPVALHGLAHIGVAKAGHGAKGHGQQD